MTDLSPRFGLPLLVAGQAQKEEGHNEAILLLEALAQPVVETLGDTAPPAAPEPGRCWIVGAAATGAWADRADALALWTEGGWRFAPAAEGMSAYLRSAGQVARFAGGAWVVGAPDVRRVTVGGVQVLGARQGGIAAPAGGATVDAEARAAIGAILLVLRAHGLVAT